jgi:hypothetical protein
MKRLVFLIILLSHFDLTLGQTIYIIGKLPNSQQEKFTMMVDNLLNRYKKINFYVNGVDNYNRLKVKKVNDVNKLKEKLTQTTEPNFSEACTLIKVKNKNKVLRISYLFEYPENNQYGMPLLFLEDIHKVLYNLKNDIIIIRLNNNQIKLENSSIVENMRVSASSNEFKGSISSKVELSSVQFRLNNEMWRDLYVEKNKFGIFEFWESISFTKLGKNNLFVRVTDNDKNVQTFTINNLDYNQIFLDDKNCRFVYPNKFGTNVEKRVFSQRSDAIVFWFKIETSADLNGLSFVRCDRNKNPIVSIPLGSTSPGEKPKFVWSAEKYYCFGLTREELNLGSSDCEYDVKGLELLSYVYLQENSNQSKGEMIPVVFSTISSEQSIRQRILRAECGF